MSTIRYLPGTTFTHTMDWSARLPSGITVSSAALADLPATWTLSTESNTTTTHAFRVVIPSTAQPGQVHHLTSRATWSSGATIDAGVDVEIWDGVDGAVSPPKDPDDTLYPVTVDFTDALPSGVTLSSASWTALTGGLTDGVNTNDTTTATLRVSGGAHGQDYLYEVAGTLSNSEVLRRRVLVPVRVQ